MVSNSAAGAPVARPAAERSAARTVAMVVSIVFLVVGVAGFIPGITAHYDTMQFAGHGSGAKLLGVFQVSVLHNIVHLLFGIAGLILARRASTAYGYLVGGGVIYAVLWLYGLLIGHGSSGANFVPLNSADNWLHLGLAVGMVALGLATRPRVPSEPANPATRP